MGSTGSQVSLVDGSGSKDTIYMSLSPCCLDDFVVLIKRDHRQYIRVALLAALNNPCPTCISHVSLCALFRAIYLIHHHHHHPRRIKTTILTLR